MYTEFFCLQVQHFLNKSLLDSSKSVVIVAVETWSIENRMELNADKCKEMRFDFKRNTHNFPPIVINGKELSVLNSETV